MISTQLIKRLVLCSNSLVLYRKLIPVLHCNLLMQYQLNRNKYFNKFEWNSKKSAVQYQYIDTSYQFRFTVSKSSYILLSAEAS